jgi:hypothetical protein
MDYTIQVLQRCKAYGFKVFLDPHQDIVSPILDYTSICSFFVVVSFLRRLGCTILDSPRLWLESTQVYQNSIGNNPLRVPKARGVPHYDLVNELYPVGMPDIVYAILRWETICTKVHH